MNLDTNVCNIILVIFQMKVISQQNVFSNMLMLIWIENLWIFVFVKPYESNFLVLIEMV
jgi:hypothetical protein